MKKRYNKNYEKKDDYILMITKLLKAKIIPKTTHAEIFRPVG